MATPARSTTPRELASGAGTISGLAVSDGFLYWISPENAHGTGPSTLNRVPLGGGKVETLAEGVFLCTGPMIVTEGRVVFSDRCDGSLVSVPASGGSPTLLVPGTPDGKASAQGLVADQGVIYWADETRGEIARVPLAGGQPVVLARGQAFAGDVVTDRQALYWTVRDDPHHGGLAGQILRQPLAGGSPVVLASAADLEPTGLTLHDGQLYWSSPGQGSISRIPTRGGAMQVLVSGQDHPVLGAVDESGLYWVTVPPGQKDHDVWRHPPRSLMWAPLDGSQAVQLYAGERLLGRLAVAGQTVYFARDEVRGALLALPR